MPDAAGNIKGSGWSREREAGWERAFGKPSEGFLESWEAPTYLLEWAEQSIDPAPEGAGSDED